MNDRFSVADALVDVVQWHGLDLSELPNEIPAWLDGMDEARRLDHTPNVALQLCPESASRLSVHVTVLDPEDSSGNLGIWNSRVSNRPQGSWLASNVGTSVSNASFSGNVAPGPDVHLPRLR